MRKLAALTFLTLDGVMQGPGSSEEDPSNGFSQGGWAVRYWDDVMPQVMQEAMSEPYDMLFGRNTYETFAAYWPHVTDGNPVAAILNTARKYVVTSKLDNLEWKNSTRVAGDIKSEISTLKEQQGPLLQIHGSGELIQELINNNLIDEFRLWTFPVVVGSGKRLFEQGILPFRLRLTKTEALPCGVNMSFYQTSQSQDNVEKG